MKTSILTTLGLCILYASFSNESPVEQPCGHCQSWDTQCYNDCLDLEGAGAARNEGPACALIRVCIKRGHQSKMCQGIPKTLPQRCRGPPPPPPPPPPPSSPPPPPSSPPPPPSSSCSCNGKQFKGPGNYPFGECITTDPKNGQYYCYVNSNTGCNDKKKSNRQANLYYSYEACAMQRGNGQFSPLEDEDCYSRCIGTEFEEQCLESCNYGIDPNYSENVATCSCENWDDVCWDNCLHGTDTNFSGNVATCSCEDWDDECYDKCLK